jgi:thiamine-monophosphate kinase
MQEFTRIATYLAPLATSAGAFSLRDDAATLTAPQGEELVLTQDTLVEGIHFRGSEPPARIAQKALRVNLSDLAAKGATPLGYLLSLSLPRSCDDAWLAAFCKGLAEDQKTYGLSLLGGDSTASKQGVVITITAIGHTPRSIRRAGAQAGDVLWLTGTIGDAALGLQNDHPHLRERYELPQPRVAFATAVRRFATAALDVSDGLLQDAQHLADVSDVALHIALDQLPLSAAAQTEDPATLVERATGGDDYEILFTAPDSAALHEAAQASNTRLTAIGRCEKGRGVNISHAEKAYPLPQKLGYTHHS